jgi:tRNA (mo5U34)-methyltransferase
MKLWARARTRLDIPRSSDPAAEVKAQAEAFRSTLKLAQEKVGRKEIRWYPYDSLSNFALFESMATPPYRDISALVRNSRVLDLGCADGATSFFLASLGFKVDAVDFPSTNYNGMRGIRALYRYFKSPVSIYSVDLDGQFRLPRRNYGFALVLGILYHLKNPFFVMEQLSHSTKYCFLSTRVAKFDPSRSSRLEGLPIAYLVSPTETNNDATNYWIFSRTGLLRLFERTGWEVCCYKHFGNLEDSDPASDVGDERAFCLLKSTKV